MDVFEENALLAQAHAAHQRGESAAAIEMLERILGENPGRVDARRGLAHVMFDASDRERAIEHMRRAIAERPGQASWHFELGRMLTDSKRMDEALEALLEAERLDPANPQYPGRIALLGPHLRNESIVLEAAQRALKLDPKQDSARLALAERSLRQGDLDGAQAMAMRLIGGSSEPIARATAMHVVGRVEEKRERWDDAFTAHERANGVKLAHPMAQDAMARGPIQFLPYAGAGSSEGRAKAKAMHASWRDREPDDGIPSPVIVTGFPRSGTTLAEQILTAHPGVASSDEWDLCRAVRRRLDAMLVGRTGAPLERLDGLTDAEVRELRVIYRRELERHVAPEERSGTLVDKHPMRVLDLGLMNRLFPSGRVVFMIRDPRDVLISAFFQDFAFTPDMVPFLSLEKGAAWYAQVMGFWLRLREVAPLEVLEVRYEDLVGDFDAWAPRMLEFAGVDWDERVREFHKPAGARMVRSSSYASVTERLHARSVARWRRYAGRLAPVMVTLAPFVEAFGYERD